MLPSPDFRDVLVGISAVAIIGAILAFAAIYALVNVMESTSKIIVRLFGPIDDREG